MMMMMTDQWQQRTFWWLVCVEAYRFHNLHRVNIENCNINTSARIVHTGIKHTATAPHTNLHAITSKHTLKYDDINVAVILNLSHSFQLCFVTISGVSENFFTAISGSMVEISYLSFDFQFTLRSVQVINGTRPGIWPSYSNTLEKVSLYKLTCTSPQPGKCMTSKVSLFVIKIYKYL